VSGQTGRPAAEIQAEVIGFLSDPASRYGQRRTANVILNRYLWRSRDKRDLEHKAEAGVGAPDRWPAGSYRSEASARLSSARGKARHRISIWISEAP
jgi:hypothetical protein